MSHHSLKPASVNDCLQPRNLRAHIIELRTTATQDRYLRKCAGTMRYVYNSLVAKWKAGDKYDRKAFQKHCTSMRQHTPWMRDVSSRATYEAADNFHQAVANFFRSRKGEHKGKKANPPKFKKRGVDMDKVRFSHKTQFSINGRHLRVAGLPEMIAMREYIRLTGTVQSVSIKRISDRWFASFLVELEEKRPAETMVAQKPSATVGVDLGLTVLAALSTGEMIENPKPLRNKLRLLKRRQRQVSRKFVKGQKKSNRHRIAALRVSRIYKKIADQRSAAQHAFTTGLVKRFGKIVIEDLAVSNMLKNRKLSRSISDAGWGSIRLQIAYKAQSAGVELVVADRFFASSKTCSCCGHKLDKLSLRTRTFVCPACSFSADRDTNAALNLAAYVPTNAPPIRGSIKTSAIDLCKSKPQGEAGLLEGANINPQRVSTEAHSVRIR